MVDDYCMLWTLGLMVNVILLNLAFEVLSGRPKELTAHGTHLPGTADRHLTPGAASPVCPPLWDDINIQSFLQQKIASRFATVRHMGDL